jgi:acyl-CoA thioesterase YciA
MPTPAHCLFSRDLAGRFPVQFLIFLLSQKPAGAAFHGQSSRRSQPGRAVVPSGWTAPLGAVVVKSPHAGRVDRVNTFSRYPMTDLQLPQKPCALRVVPQPSDANVHGDVFGGWIMAQVDIAGSIPASRRANGRVATIAVNSFVFKQPVFVGDLLSFYADIVKTGNTSVTVSVEVYAQRMSLTEDLVKVTEATLTYVATDSDRRPRALPVLD